MRQQAPQIQIGLDRWLEAASKQDDPATLSTARHLAEDNEITPTLLNLLGNSPFLTRCLCADPVFVVTALEQSPDQSLTQILNELKTQARDAKGPPALDRALRIARRKVALVTAIADISGAWPLETVTGTLSNFAAIALQLALSGHLAFGAKAGVFEPQAAEETAAEHSGIFILGMGKLGGRELNYSSDIDIIALFDPVKVPVRDPDRMRQNLVRLTQSIVASLHERTADGYVFRTDLRLRPDPSSTPLIISTAAAESYYESMGQNWERAAMIKADVTAGDHESGADFLRMLEPFIWRRNLDFAAIQDVHSIKRQINAHRGGGEIAIHGHNIKLGRGGIREIEFFVQTQQLIFGGRDPKLRTKRTLEGLQRLADAERITQSVAEEMTHAYHFLRKIEHRLQMVDDQQTHSLPDTDEGLATISNFAGYPTTDAFTDDLMYHMRTVEQNYAALFEEAPSLSGPGNLVFTGAEHDPDTLATLTKMGFEDAEKASTYIRNWHHGRYVATRSTRARELLTELVPTILTAFSETARPDEALKRFDGFVSALPTGVQIFSLLHANPQLLTLLADIFGTAPLLAAGLSHRPALIEAVLSGDFFDPIPDRAALDEEYGLAVKSDATFEDNLDTTRRWAGDRRFQAGVQLLTGASNVTQIGRALSDVADTVITGLLPRIEAEFAARHGQVEGAGFCILALGKLGGQELSPASDLDLVFVYDDRDSAKQSDGDKPLAISHYFARYAQRVLSALTAQTSEGPLYEVDMRLRPSGAQGPLASSHSAFLKYQEEGAWTWEQLALTRGRLVAGTKEFGERLAKDIQNILCRPRDAATLWADVSTMRERIATAHKTNSIWKIKHLRGGLLDFELMVQALQLQHAESHPSVVQGRTAEALSVLADMGALENEDAARLIEINHLYLTVQAILRVTLAESFDADTAHPALISRLVAASGEDSFDSLTQRLEESAAFVYRKFNSYAAA